MSPMPDAERERRVIADSQRRLSWFWMVFLMLAFGMGLYVATAGELARLASEQGVWVSALIVLFLITHHWYWNHPDAEWPRDDRAIAIALTIQIGLLLPLLTRNVWFGGGLIALLGQVSASMAPRRWWLPMAAPVLLLLAQLGVIDLALAGAWRDIGVILLAVSWLILVLLYAHLTIDERGIRAHLLADIRVLRDEIRGVRAPDGEIARLRRRLRETEVLADQQALTLDAVARAVNRAGIAAADDRAGLLAALADAQATLAGAPGMRPPGRSSATAEMAGLPRRAVPRRDEPTAAIGSLPGEAGTTGSAAPPA
jgi:hypothetical protein